jgi:diamine N-acetyltransferase
MSTPRLVRVTPDNVIDACELRVRPDQEGFVAPVAQSLAEAYAQPEIAWPRLVYDGEDLVGFIMCAFDPNGQEPDFRCGIWRLNIAAGRQGHGYGRFAVESACAEAVRRGARRITVSWVDAPNGPERFYLRLGFRRTGRVLDGEIVAERSLGPA